MRAIGFVFETGVVLSGGMGVSPMLAMFCDKNLVYQCLLARSFAVERH
jgi:hypothetical protein